MIIDLDAFGARASTLSTWGSGTITLEHDLYQATEARAPGMIDRILATAMVPQPVSQCSGLGSPYADKSLVIPNSMTLAVVSTGTNSTTTSGNKPSKSGATADNNYLGYFWTASLLVLSVVFGLN